MNILQEFGHEPAMATLKANPECATGDIVAQAFSDKGFDSEVLSSLARADLLGPVACGLVLRHPSHPLGHMINELDLTSPHTPSYLGTQNENAIIDASIARSLEKGSRERAAARLLGIAAIFSYYGPTVKEYIDGVPTVVVGSGPAGIMAARALELAGFNPQRMTIIDKHGGIGGVWDQPNVRDGVIGNPFPIEFAGLELSQGPKPGTEIRDFIGALATGEAFKRSLPAPIKGRVTRIEPGDLHHKVTYKRGTTEHSICAPLIFNAVGTGRPLPPNNPSYMTTNTERLSGPRWQKILTREEAEKLRDKQVVFVGLCNSTGTMLRQIAAFKQQGLTINYKILTHMPEQAVRNPDKNVTVGGQTYRVYRDLENDDLTAYEGDTENGIVYQHALRENRIITDVTHWDRGQNTLTYVQHNQTLTIPCDYLMTLIGYAQRPDVLEHMGLHVTDPYLGAVAFDYDGEVQKQPGMPGRSRLYPGYYLQGAIRRTPQNPNAPVLSSIVHGAFDTTFGAIVRAMEHAKDPRLSECCAAK